MTAVDAPSCRKMSQKLVTRISKRLLWSKKLRGMRKRKQNKILMKKRQEERIEAEKIRKKQAAEKAEDRNTKDGAGKVE